MLSLNLKIVNVNLLDLSTVKKQKDVIHKTQIFQEARKTKTLNKKQIHIETRGKFQKIPKILQ